MFLADFFERHLMIHSKCFALEACLAGLLVPFRNWKWGIDIGKSLARVAFIYFQGWIKTCPGIYLEITRIEMSTYTTPAQLRKLEGPNYQHKFATGRKVYVEEIAERQLLIRGRAFAAYSTIDKALAVYKKSFRGPHAARGPYVVQAWLTPFNYANFLS